MCYDQERCGVMVHRCESVNPKWSWELWIVDFRTLKVFLEEKAVKHLKRWIDAASQVASGLRNGMDSHQDKLESQENAKLIIWDFTTCGSTGF